MPTYYNSECNWVTHQSLLAGPAAPGQGWMEAVPRFLGWVLGVLSSSQGVASPMLELGWLACDLTGVPGCPAWLPRDLGYLISVGLGVAGDLRMVTVHGALWLTRACAVSRPVGTHPL